MSALPEFLRPYFWEVDFERLDLAQRKTYILERILEYGDDQAIRWLLGNCNEDEIGDVVRASRALSANTGHLWALVLKIPLEEITCISKPSPIALGKP